MHEQAVEVDMGQWDMCFVLPCASHLSGVAAAEAIVEAWAQYEYRALS